MKKKFLILFVILIMFCNSITVFAQTATGNRYIDTTHGYLTGEVSCAWAGSVLREKQADATAKTKTKVSRIRATLNVCYYNSGKTIATETSNWINNDNKAYTYSFEGSEVKNSETGKYDGFINTKIVAYGAADAIQEKAYVVYTKVIN